MRVRVFCCDSAAQHRVTGEKLAEDGVLRRLSV